MKCEIKEYRNSDLLSLRTVYSCCILHLDESAYSKEQVAAWSSFPEDSVAFQEWVGGAATFVALSNDGACIGFGGLGNGGRISSVFVMPGCMRNGVGSVLLKHLIEEAKSRGFAGVTTEASEFSKPLFEKFGFGVVEVERTEFKGVEFNRYVMRASI
jgi:putative acetyltransferase